MTARILLDSNIWRYVVNADAVAQLRRAARKSTNRILVAPAILFEAAHTGDDLLRSTLLKVLADPAWKRLMPEAYSEAEEFKGEARRLRAEWCRTRPNLQWYRRIRYDWKRLRGGVWERMPNEAHLLQQHDAAMLRRARDQAISHRDGAKEWSPKWQTANLTKTMAGFPSPLPGWNGQPVEAWRVNGLTVFSEAIKTPGHPTIDWVAEEIDLGLVSSQPASLAKFWLHDVDVLRMQRHWLRWGFEFLQQLHRVTDGTPVDCQLGSYLVEADLMVSADKILVHIAERCRSDAPFPIAESRLVPGGAGAVDAVLKLL